MRRFVARLLQDRSGATAIEYGLIVALIFLAIVTAVTAFGNVTSDIINTAMYAVRDTLAPASEGPQA